MFALKIEHEILPNDFLVFSAVASLLSIVALSRSGWSKPKSWSIRLARVSSARPTSSFPRTLELGRQIVNNVSH